MEEKNIEFYNGNDIKHLKQLILPNWKDFASYKTRWKIETTEEVNKLIKYIKDGFVLCDFGIGIGRIAKALLERLKNITIIGIDSSGTMLKYCKKYIPSEFHDRLKLFNIKEIEKIESDSMDFMYAFMTLQHISADIFEDVLKEMNRTLKPEGKLYLINQHKRAAFNPETKEIYDDGLNQMEIIKKYFDEIEPVNYDHSHMITVLKSHFSKIFQPKK